MLLPGGVAVGVVTGVCPGWMGARPVKGGGEGWGERLAQHGCLVWRGQAQQVTLVRLGGRANRRACTMACPLPPPLHPAQSAPSSQLAANCPRPQPGPPRRLPPLLSPPRARPRAAAPTSHSSTAVWMWRMDL